MTDADAPPPQTEAPRPPEPPPQRRLPLPALLIAAAIAFALAAAYLVMRSGPANDAAGGAYVVQPYTPATEIVTASDRVLAHAAPDPASPTVVMFGQGVTLNITGRVSRGLSGDWYAISWNNQTAFVRREDVAAGHGAPPVAEQRPHPSEPQPEKPNPFEMPDQEDVATSPTPPSAGGALTDFEWIRAPSSRDFARYYPHRALDQGRSGRVVLDCVADRNGRLDCSVAQESPSGYGFGDAALAISRQLRIRPTRPDGSSVAGGRLRLPLSFQAD